MHLNPVAETKIEIINYFKELEKLDSSFINIPVKIIKWYVHHFNPQNIINTLIDLNPWPHLKPYADPIIEYFWGPKWPPEGWPMENGFEQDEFGFKKIIFGLTKTHTTISAISTKSGYVEWNLNLEKELEKSNFLNENKSIIFS